MNSAPPIGIIGLGAMGQAVAARLLDQGHSLAVHDIRPEAAAALAGRGARVAASPAEVAGWSRTVLTLLPDPAAVRAACLGSDGLFSAATADHLVADLTTSSPELSRELAARFAARGTGFLDVGVLGNPPTARVGKMTLLVGGEKEHVARARPVLKVLSANVRHLGPPGAGHVAKVAANELFLAQVAAMGEALAVLEAAGAAAEPFLEALACTGGRGVGLADIGRTMLGPAPVAGFALRLAAKDAGLLNELAHQVGHPAPLAGVLRELYAGAAAAAPDQDFTGIFQYARGLRARGGRGD
jgi:3-hydroxyisobutyrate dehydrogenase-like beta-hydroxyacid dehydrogenase